MGLAFKPAFILGAQRSGTTLLERMLSSHSLVQGGPEPHLLTPLAYLGFWGRVEKAPYDHIVAALGQQQFVASLPHQEEDYWKACRAYCDVLYGARMAGSARQICLDKTPEYATVWPFLLKVFPDAKYIVLTRHPGAIFCSFANSFFDGDCEVAQRHEPILERYIPAIAGFLRQDAVPLFHLHYEDLVGDPVSWMQKLCAYLEIPFEAGIIEYGNNPDRQGAASGLGDPIGVRRHSRPTAAHLNQWAEELARDENKLRLLRAAVERLNPDDLATIGYPLSSFWSPLEQVRPGVQARGSGGRLTAYRLQRKFIIKARKLAQRSVKVRAGLEWLRLACDVLLRQY